MAEQKDKPTETREPPGLIESLAALARRDVYLNVPIHVCILIPATCLIAYLAVRLDRHFGWSRVVDSPLNYVLFAILFPLGVFIVWYTYGYLSIMGDGSPATHLGGTRKLVTSGPFALCRHPSIVGKFTGVLSLGFLVGSPTFLFIIIPLLTTYSLVSVRFLQEKLCVRLWGEDYLQYRRTVSLVIPDLRRLRYWNPHA